MNFVLNKFWVFESRKRSLNEAFLYTALFCGQMTLSWLLVTSLKQLPLNLTLIKVLVDTGLFFISYAVQKNFIFHKNEERNAIPQ
jgi:putative flippase GtrA